MSDLGGFCGFDPSDMTSSGLSTETPVPETERMSSGSNAETAHLDTNSETHDYMNLLRRIQTSSSPDTGAEDIVSSQRYDKIVPLLLRQPPEIISHILFWLDPGDLLHLRATNHRLHDLVHGCERSICLSFADRMVRDHDFNSPLRPAQNLSHFFAKYRAFEAVSSIAAMGADRISTFMKNRNLTGDKVALLEWRQKKATRLRGKLKRSLLILQFYLDFLSTMIMTTDCHFQNFSDDEYSALHNIYDLDQQYFISENMSWLTEQDFVDVSCTLAILKGLCKGRNVAFPLKSHGYPFASVRSVFVYGGLGPLSRLLPTGLDIAKQTTILRQLNEDLVPRKKGKVRYANNASPLTSIHHLNGRNDRIDEETYHRRNSKVRERFIGHQDIWDKAARACMMRKLGRFPSTQSASSWIQKIALEEGEKESEITIGPWESPESG